MEHTVCAPSALRDLRVSALPTPPAASNPGRRMWDVRCLGTRTVKTVAMATGHRDHHIMTHVSVWLPPRRRLPRPGAGWRQRNAESMPWRGARRIAGMHGRDGSSHCNPCRARCRLDGRCTHSSWRILAVRGSAAKTLPFRKAWRSPTWIHGGRGQGGVRVRTCSHTGGL